MTITQTSPTRPQFWKTVLLLCTEQTRLIHQQRLQIIRHCRRLVETG